MGILFDRFEGLSLALLVLAGISAGAWLLVFAARWVASYPKMPAAGPETTDLGDEPPAIVNLLAHRWTLTRAALAATFLDLAARRIISIDLLGRGAYVVRLRETPREPLLKYEQQLLDLVRSRATGGSAPLQVLTLGEEHEAERFWKKFRERVIDDAKGRGLARNRWSPNDWTVLGALLLAPIGFFALAMGQAGIGNGGEDPMTRWDWLLFGGIGWVAIMVAVSRFQAIRDTPAGRAVCAQWLGVRKAFEKSTAFGDAPPSHVILWERNLSQAAALGLAHDAVHALPFEAEDPETAWSRVTGSWRELRVEYPERFGFGMAPIKAVWQGLWRVAVFGFIAFFALPIVFNIAYDIASSALDSSQDYRLKVLMFAIGIPLTGAGVYVFVRFIAGMLWLVRGLADLGRWVTTEGEVVKIARGRVALDDGKSEELTAWTLPYVTGPGIRQGAKLRIHRSPHLWFVDRVEVITPAPRLGEMGEADVETPEEAGQIVANAFGAAVAMVPTLDLAALKSATGIDFIPDDQQGSMAGLGFVAGRTYTDGKGNGINISVVTVPAVAGIAGKLLMRAVSRQATRTQAGSNVQWMSERAAMITDGSRMITVSVDLVDDDREKETAELVVRMLTGS